MMKVEGKRQTNGMEVEFTLEHPDAGAVEFDGYTLSLVDPGDLYVMDLIGKLDGGWMHLGPQGKIGRVPHTQLAGVTGVTHWRLVSDE